MIIKMADVAVKVNNRYGYIEKQCEKDCVRLRNMLQYNIIIKFDCIYFLKQKNKYKKREEKWL